MVSIQCHAEIPMLNLSKSNIYCGLMCVNFDFSWGGGEGEERNGQGEEKRNQNPNSNQHQANCMTCDPAGKAL